MSAVIGLGGLFSRKGEAVPAVQPAIPNAGRSRFEDLARALGQSMDPRVDGDILDDDDVAEAIAAASPVEDATAPPSSVTPFRRMAAPEPDPVVVSIAGRAGLSDDPDPDGEDDADDDGDTDADAGLEGAAPLGGGMIHRTAPPEPGPMRPWESLRQSQARRHDAPEAPVRRTTTPAVVPPRRGAAVTLAAGYRAPSNGDAPPWIRLKGTEAEPGAPVTTAPLDDPEEIELYLFGPDAPPDVAGRAAAEAEADVRRRHVGVRLPAREHDLLRQFAKLSGSTQQDIIRRSLLTYMIEQLRQRLDEPPAQARKTKA
ncbi:hypothetical protein [Roseospira navarrensis]|uniref:Uncharacterized protein n=1 Tax=Roseospira navarrensis TaxID=140058 RepID=A0A7X2D285_9PROT|nr:hypothetical protein [Roseospira navarrensis]MQX36039.1 hypothetical protein [Roseospira navarrensis]